jgi:hypothetical protein
VVAVPVEYLGYTIHGNIWGYGAVGVLRKVPRKGIILRAELASLLILEETGLRYACEERINDQHGFDTLPCTPANMTSILIL